jgi:ABC-type amino acid transport substrate-binding protein
MEAASFFSSSLVTEREPFDFLTLYIPSNPIYAMGHNIVPAVVLFSSVLGIALIGVENKSRLIRGLDVLADALTLMSGFVARLAPLGVFALIGSAAGTISLQELSRLQIYVVTYTLLSLALTLWILPGLVSTLTPLSWKEIVPPVRGAIITAFAAGNLLIVIPILSQLASEMATSKATDRDRAVSAVEVIVPASFNFPSAGKLLSLAFLPFAGWFVGSDISLAQYPQFLVTGLFTFFAVTSIAIPQLLDFLRLPADLFQIFVTLDVITGRLQIMVAAMSTVALALLGAFAMSGSLRVEPVRIIRFAGISIAIVAALLLGTRFVYGSMLSAESTTYRKFISMDLANPRVPVTLVTKAPSVPEEHFGGSRLARIDSDRLLRVCYFKDSLPMAFVNTADRLVGFDVDMAHSLASQLGTELMFIRVQEAHIADHLNGGTCDIAMSIFVPTPQSTRDLAISTSYLTVTLAFVTKDHLRDRFSTWKKLADSRELHIATPGADQFVSLLRDKLPYARFTPVASARDYFLAEEGTFDGAFHAAEIAAAWTLVYPQFTIVVPEPGRIRIPIAYPMPHGATDLVRFVDSWIELEREKGALDKLFDHWILGRAAETGEPRWSVIRDVLGWVD